MATTTIFLVVPILFVTIAIGHSEHGFPQHPAAVKLPETSSTDQAVVNSENPQAQQSVHHSGKEITDDLDEIKKQNRSARKTPSSSIRALLNAIKSHNEALAIENLEKLPSKYNESPEEILREAAANLRSDSTTLVRLFKFVAENKGTSHIELAVRFQERQEAAKVDTLEELILGVQIIAQVLNDSSQLTTKESEERLIKLILTNLLTTLPSDRYQDWEDLNSWLGKDFYRVFKKLTKSEIYHTVLRVFENSRVKQLERYQLEYLEKLYYFCADTKVVFNPQRGPENFFNFTECNEALQKSRKVPHSLRQDVINESESEGIAAADVIEYRVASVVSEYKTPGPQQDENSRPYRFTINDENLWLSYVLDAVFDGVAKGAIKHDPRSTDKIFRTLIPMKTGLSKYPLLSDYVTKRVNSLYKEFPSNILPAIQYLSDLPDSLEKMALRTLLSLVRERTDKLGGDQTIILAGTISSLGLQNESIWDEIPEQAKLLAGLTKRKVMKWMVKIKNETFEIYGQDDGTVALRPMMTEENAGGGSTTRSNQIWGFQGSFLPDYTLQVFLIDTAKEKYGRLGFLLREGGGLMHELDLKGVSGNYPFYVSLTEGFSGFNLRYVGASRPICVVRDESKKPVRLQGCRGENSEVAEFFVAPDGTDFKKLLQKLF